MKAQSQTTNRQDAPETRDDELVAAFREYHAKFPEVYRQFVRISLWLIHVGIDGVRLNHFSAQGVLALVRATSRAGDDTANAFRVNNNFARFYSDLFRGSFPQLTAFFDTRERVSKTKPAVNLPALTPIDFKGAGK